MRQFEAGHGGELFAYAFEDGVVEVPGVLDIAALTASLELTTPFERVRQIVLIRL